MASKPFDQAGINQKPVEAARFGSIVAAKEEAFAALKNGFLFDERWIERHARCLEDEQRQIGRVQAVDGNVQIARRELDRVDGIVSFEKTRIAGGETAHEHAVVLVGIDHRAREVRLVVAEAHDQETLFGKIALQARKESRVVDLGQMLPPQIFVDVGAVPKSFQSFARSGRKRKVQGK